MTYLNCFTLKRIFRLCYVLTLGISVVDAQKTPDARLAHATVLLKDRLYSFAGFSTFETREVYYLNVSRSFNYKRPPWVNLTSVAAMPFRSSWLTATFVDPTIYVFGGETYDPITSVPTNISFVHAFNPKTLEWSVPKTKGIPPTRRRNTHAVHDKSGKVYIFGGLGIDPKVPVNDTVIFDTKTFTWSYGANAPKTRHVYTATMLPSGVIVYIGGIENSKIVDIREILLYDTNSDSWNLTMATNINVVGSRAGHSAVLAPNGEIIVCGGGDDLERVVQVHPNVIVLNTKKNPFEWVVPYVSSKIGEVPTLVAHKANLVNNHMIVTFGNITQRNDFPMGVSSDVYLFDIKNYTWVDRFKNRGR